MDQMKKPLFIEIHRASLRLELVLLVHDRHLSELLEIKVLKLSIDLLEKLTIFIISTSEFNQMVVKKYQ